MKSFVLAFFIFDIAGKKVKDNSGSSFEQSWWYSRTQCYIQNFIAIGLVAFRELFEIVTLQSWNKGQRMTLTSCIHNSLIHEDNSKYQFLGQSLQKTSMKSNVLAFFISDLALKRSMSSQGHQLNNLGSARVPSAAY